VTAEPSETNGEKLMNTKIPVALEGNLTADPEFGIADSGVKWARFQLAINDRVKDDTTGEWTDGTPAFHRVTAFGRIAENVRDSLTKGDTALVLVDLKQTQWVDKTTGEQRTGTEVIADAVGPSMKYRTATVSHPVKAVDGSIVVAVTATGPVAQPWATAQIGTRAII
jgi:single-strand DNA-binding protein